MSVRREAANRVTINCWYQRDSAVQLVSTLGSVDSERVSVQRRGHAPSTANDPTDCCASAVCTVVHGGAGE
jgi:hypothetical protein